MDKLIAVKLNRLILGDASSWGCYGICRDPDFIARQRERHRPDCQSAQSDKRLCYIQSRKHNS